MRTIKKCLVCETTFRMKPSQQKRRKYCSRPCFETSHRATMSGTNNPSYKKGKPHCVACKKQLSHYGHYDGKPDRCKECARSHNKGKNHYNWQGGKTSTSMKIRNSLEYKSWRQGVFERDGFRCVWCGKKGGELQADHINPFAFYPELRFEQSNGRTLCKDCHKKTNTYLIKARYHEKHS